jgi:hypothetical protein
MGGSRMMTAIFATLRAFVFFTTGPRWLAISFGIACLGLSIGLFLFEVYSPEYGFRMPWLQVQIGLPATGDAVLTRA